jgi:hypothetical protein
MAGHNLILSLPKDGRYSQLALYPKSHKPAYRIGSFGTLMDKEGEINYYHCILQISLFPATQNVFVPAQAIPINTPE